ncbi:helix-turn-helix domain-containing protein [Hydrogenophaga sp.]|uniref:GlxA family transcriptional regulator n=1 Tax=Hydrogenophaga sp. TaxID=1904254 RepID=UPI002610CDB6|nr:helix-turn-helix domain-containing protein [Hydrogenophaga sp.]MDM7950605.1 helix-turn-helix domain-containing protein [Hydrogenophaga sp.]
MPASSSRSMLRQPLQLWEILRCDEGLEGPLGALADLLRMVNTIARLRGLRHERVALQHRTPTGRITRGMAAIQTREASSKEQIGRARLPSPWLPDVLVVPGWQARNGPHLNRLVARDRAACDRLRAVHAAGGQVIGLFTGVALLAEAGLLDNSPAVIPWPFVPAVLRHAPSLQIVTGASHAQHQRVWTVDSPLLATDVALMVLQAGGLQALAESARAVLLHSPQRQGLVRAVAQDARSRVGLGSLERARRWLEDHLHEPYSLSDTARAAATSERSLLRHFGQAFGQTPLQMLHELRVTRARMLLETTYLSSEAIAERCGWRDPVMLREVFRRATGMTPAAYRERFRLRSSRREWGKDLA